jgi:integrase/recombinase XerD
LCRDCGFRFSEKSNIASGLISGRQLCAVSEEAKKLDSQAETKTLAGTSLKQQTRKGTIIEFMLYMKKQGFRPTTIKTRAEHVSGLMTAGADLNNPEDVKFVIAEKKCSEGYKKNLVLAYDTYLRMRKIKWDAPKYKPVQRLPFIPLEREIDQLISALGGILSLFCAVLKDTGADPSEASAIEWRDVDMEKKTIMINNPVKGHKARIITVSRELISRLESVPKATEKPFNARISTMQKNFELQRKRVAKKFNNPRLRDITFTTFRYWKATMEYHKTKDILWVMRLLGHNSLKTTLIYIDLETALFREANDEFTVKVADSITEACKLLEVGFEYVFEMEGKRILRKRK